jgi:hypothetical protein
MWKIKSSLLLLVLVMLCRVAAADETNFVPPEHIDLTKILAPAPARGSDREKRDLAEILAIQKSRTSRQSERALADATAGIFGFAEVSAPASMNSEFLRLRRCLGRRARMRLPLWDRQKPSGTVSDLTPSAPKSKRSAIAQKAVPIRVTPPPLATSQRYCSLTWCPKRQLLFTLGDASSVTIGSY